MLNRILAFLCLTLFSYAGENLSSFVQEENMHYQTYDNGISTLVYSSKKTPERASFRIMIKRTITDEIDKNLCFLHEKDPFAIDKESSDCLFLTHSLVTSEMIEYGLETTQTNPKNIDNFFQECKQKILDEIEKDQELTKLKHTEESTQTNTIERAGENHLFCSERTFTIYPDPLKAITIVAVGDFDVAEVEQYFKEEFATISRFAKITQLPPAFNDLSDSDKSLEEYWENYVYKTLLRNKLKERSLSSEEKISEEENPFSAASYDPSLDASLNESPLFYQAIDELASNGFSEEELQKAIEISVLHLDRWEEGEYNDTTTALADMYSFPNGFKTHALSLKELKLKSIEILKKLKANKLWLKAKDFFLKEKHKFFPPKSQATFSDPTPIGSKPVTHKPKDPRQRGHAAHVDPFLKLPITIKEKKTIAHIINTMAENNVISLLFKKSDLTKKGDSIYHVHPFRFLETVFTDQKLTRNVKKFSDNYFKWSNFIDGLSEKLHKEAKHNNLLPYLPGFAARIQIPQEQLRPYIMRKDWEGMIQFMLKSLL